MTAGGDSDLAEHGSGSILGSDRRMVTVETAGEGTAVRLLCAYSFFLLAALRSSFAAEHELPVR
jgi:hypothetical protein